MSDLREALKPCPFCGGNDIRFDKHHSYNYSHPDFKFHWSMCCYNCGATFPNRYRKELLVAAWNTRAALAQPEAVEPVAYLHSGDFKEGAAEDVQYFEVTVSLYPAVGFDVPIYTTPPLAPDERMRRALEFYADPIAWKKKNDPDDLVRIPDFYSELSFGDKAKEVLDGHGQDASVKCAAPGVHPTDTSCTAEPEVAPGPSSHDERMRRALEAIEPYLDAIVCYASSINEHHGNEVAKLVREALSRAGG